MIHVVYFNQWFSSITPVMMDIKRKYGESIKIVASSKNPGHAYKQVVDKFIVEDWQEDDEDCAKKYSEWLSKILQENSVDVAFIYRHQDWVTDNISDILSNNTSTRIVLDTRALDTFSKKSEMYKSFSQQDELKSYVPKYWDISSENSVGIELLKKNTPGLCFKLDSDVGGESFRRVTSDKISGLNIIKQPQAHRMSYDDTLKLFSSLNKDELKQILFMEYLHGPEISADCYNSKKGFICLCRAKTNGRVESIYLDKNIDDICQNIARIYGLKYPFNVQFRFNKQSDREPCNLKITDINLRLSGGSYLELACGINLCEICMLDAINKHSWYDLESYIKFKERSVTHFETAIEV